MGPERLDRAALKYACEDTGCDEAQYESLDVKEKTPELNHRKNPIEEKGAIPIVSSTHLFGNPMGKKNCSPIHGDLIAGLRKSVHELEGVEIFEPGDQSCRRKIKSMLAHASILHLWNFFSKDTCKAKTSTLTKKGDDVGSTCEYLPT